MIEGVENGARRIEPIDQAGIEVRHEELFGCPVENDIAKPGAAIGGNSRKQRNFAGCTVDLVNAAGRSRCPTGCTPLPGHELGIGRPELGALRGAAGIGHHELKAESGGGGEINVWCLIGKLGGIERDTEDLPDVTRLGGEHCGRGDQLP